MKLEEFNKLKDHQRAEILEELAPRVWIKRGVLIALGITALSLSLSRRVPTVQCLGTGAKRRGGTS